MKTEAALIPGRATVSFIVLTFALSTPLYIAIARYGMQPAVLTAMMCCPAVAALASATIFRVPLRAFGWRLPALRYMLAGYLIPLCYVTVGYVAVWTFGLGKFYNPAYVARIGAMFHLHNASPAVTIAVAFLFTATVATLIDMLPVIGEEIGWRGFLVPALAQRFGFAGVAVTSGCIWALWHYPGIFWSGYNGGNEPWFAAACFTILIVSISVPMAWLRLRSRSMWPAVVFHAAHNALIQAFFTGVTLKLPATRYFIDEFGLGLLPFVLALAVYFVYAKGPGTSPRRALESLSSQG